MAALLVGRLRSRHREQVAHEAEAESVDGVGVRLGFEIFRLVAAREPLIGGRFDAQAVERRRPQWLDATGDCGYGLVGVLPVFVRRRTVGGDGCGEVAAEGDQIGVGTYRLVDHGSLHVILLEHTSVF